MAEPRITLIQVAARAGVSKTTAGYVLTGQDRERRISVETRDRVLRAATEMNFRPNLLARSLRTTITRPIAFISDTLATEAHGGQLIHGCMAAAAGRGRLVILGETRRDQKLEAAFVEMCVDEQIGDYVYATVYPRAVHLPERLRDKRVVMLNCASGDKTVASILPDEVGAGRTAAKTLLDSGHRDGIYLVGDRAPHKYAPGRDRFRGLTHVLADAGTHLAGVLDCPWEAEAAFEAVSATMSAAPQPKAFICSNDRVALGTYQALHESGIHIPQEVSVISFGDSPLAVALRPQLTGIAHPHFEMGHRAVDLLMSAEHPHGFEYLPMPLSRRASVAAPRPGPD